MQLKLKGSKNIQSRSEVNGRGCIKTAGYFLKLTTALRLSGWREWPCFSQYLKVTTTIITEIITESKANNFSEKSCKQLKVHISWLDTFSLDSALLVYARAHSRNSRKQIHGLAIVE